MPALSRKAVLLFSAHLMVPAIGMVFWGQSDPAKRIELAALPKRTGRQLVAKLMLAQPLV
jgi:hypothetical protein